MEELLQLWRGMPAYGVCKDVGHREFILRGMLLWTIHDYPSYGAVGGFSHQRYADVSIVDLIWGLRTPPSLVSKLMEGRESSWIQIMPTDLRR